ncbi:MAG: dihydrodipicolinate synthase family protein [Vagococcus sp.]|uniref:dihydrodipicolinate synthase family protein n=1 Tax=Vagococcus TaxID=2737 RepID=UPI002FC61668
MKIKGIVTAMVTPVNATGGIDEQATRKLVNRLIDSGIHGLFILGTNGEFYALTDAEKIELAKIVVEETNGRVPVFAGAGGISTEGVIHLAKEFGEIGVDAISVITPFLIKIDDDELTRHYETIADESPLPVILYAIPKNTGIHISEGVYDKLITHSNIVGIKDSGGDIDVLKMYIEKNKRDDFSVLVGSDSLILDALSLGADGAVAATSNVLTKTDIGIYQLFLEGDLDKARSYQLSINEFRRILKFGTVPSVLKESLVFIGDNVGHPKTPVLPVSEEHTSEIKEVLRLYQEIEGYEV